MSELARTAILGTQQVPPGGDETGTPADALVAKLGTSERERALLLRVGAAAILRRAGVRAASLDAALDAAPAETLGRASPRLSDMLARLLRGEHPELVPEAAAGAKARGLRLPEELLPLALGVANPEMRAHFAPLLGTRGAWLGARRDAWSWATAATVDRFGALPGDADARWLDGNSAERATLLALARRSEPERARRWLSETLKSEKPELRVKWLEALGENLSPADVPLIEGSLSDRSPNVRLVAARLLWRIPETTAAKAMAARLEASFPVKAPSGGLLGKLKSVVGKAKALDVELPPEKFDKELEKLGVTETPPSSDVGRRQWWLAQHVAAVAPDWFEKRLGATPEALVASAEKHDFARALVNGWTDAALRFRARNWWAPLWDAWYALEGTRAWFENEPLAALTPLLTASEREERLLRALRDGKRVELFEHLPQPWPEAVAKRVAAQLFTMTPHTWILMPLAAARLPLSSLPAPPATEGMNAGFIAAVDDFTSKAEFRRRLAEELSK